MVDLHQEFASSRFFNEDRIDRRSTDALVGLAAGVVADGVVNVDEARFLKGWIESNLAHLEDPVVNLLYRRISTMLQDGILDAEEAADLMHLLHSFAGLVVGRQEQAAQFFTAPSDLPFNFPAPDLVFQDRVFVFTGTMAYGPRKACEALILERGGVIGGGVSKKIHYLVVGSIGNDQWRHATYGTKIMKAVELREAGAPIAIVGEDHWQRALFG
ncbi:TPA: BRCT domain-containing protein [Pseudomonas aeruginosa]|uniref:BRCT domain-containing protein n=1 Tax=Pseudomonas aeruginosa TaxID=287 RepID=UPI000E316450|nr:BRCT domain-containing protein [Pseudomonas aeruginosa]EKX5751822.1 BRCT domain-containing protein [Pseudomonas aeruginosa]NPX38617.1 NAD-dependent DNA ligase [Pseudomonas aeruginosa]HCF5643920.1 BRCT domain-containing protein [Pseudomonas aeruginosa]